MDLQNNRWNRIAGVCFAGKRGGKGRWLLLWIGLTPIPCRIVDDTGGGSIQQRGRHRPLRISEELVDFCLGQVGAEGRCQAVAGNRVILRLSHHRGTYDHANGVEGHRRAVAVGIHNQRRLQHAIVTAVTNQWLCRIDVALAHGDAVTERVAGLLYQQVVGIVFDEGLGPYRVGVERVTVTTREEEVLAGVSKLLRRASAGNHSRM